MTVLTNPAGATISRGEIVDSGRKWRASGARCIGEGLEIGFEIDANPKEKGFANRREPLSYWRLLTCAESQRASYRSSSSEGSVTSL